MSFSRTQLRRLAACLLLGWLLAFSVSVAHACGLTPGLAEGGRDAVALAVERAADSTPSVDNSSCVKFCEDSNKSVPGVGSIAALAPGHLHGVALWLLRPDLDLTIPALRAAWMRDEGRRPPRELPIELQRLTL